MASSPSAHAPHWYGVPVRVALLTFLGTLISFAVFLMLAIPGTAIVAALRGVHPDMRIAYRLVALPGALAVGAVIFVAALVMEIRHFRQTKTLTAIERISRA